MKNFLHFVIFLFLLNASLVRADANQSEPNVQITPEQVVRIVIEALKTNDPSKNDDGIATVFEFASPGNKSATGPLQRFTKMIKGGFGQMLNHIDSEFGPMEIKENTALQAVWLTTRSGQQIGYVFQIGKQVGGEFNDMWMTESVWPIGERKPPRQSI